jgi:activator of HSP90 ATPase
MRIKTSLKLSAVIPVARKRLNEAWLNARDHGAFTGAEAQIQPRVGGRFTTWNGYISGRTIELTPPNRIVQAWRTTEFPAGSPDSRLELLFDVAKTGTRLTLIQTDLPPGHADQYKVGWRDYYFAPMREYFAAAAPK